MPSAQLEPLKAALAGRYAIERELGSGGMATVYLADDLKHHRKVAVKVLAPQLASVLGSERFLREVEIAAKLNHPYILGLYDSGELHPEAGEGPPLLYYVMPYVQGESLRHRLRREKQLSVEEALTIIRQVAAALAHAHARHVVHRDIKPENILLHEGAAMVTDFGIALAASTARDRLTETGLVVGTPEYMSPEQAAGEPDLDARSDEYSLACVLYEMLTGEPPYTGPTAQAVMVKRVVDPIPSVRRLRPAVPAGLAQALTRGLGKAPADRFPSVAAFAEALSKPAEAQEKRPSVAVLPFQNLSPDPESEYFAEGMTEDVIAQLSKIKAIKVISRTSVLPFKKRELTLKEIGARLEVATLLEGSVRRAGDRVRIVAQLIDAETDEHLWAETYDRRLTDIFAIQTDVALQIAASLKAELSPAERTRMDRGRSGNLQAYRLYLQGRQHYAMYTEESIKEGIEFYRQATVVDPGYAEAYVGMGLAYAELAAGQGGGGIRPDVAYHHGLDAATKALAINPELGEAHAVLALLKMTHDFDWAGAEAEFKLALELNPGGADIHDHYGWLSAALERWDEALAFVRRAQELDPLMHRADLATTFLRAGRYQEGLEAALRCVEVEPDYSRGRSTLGWAYLLNGRPEEGLTQLQMAVHLYPENTLYLAQLGEAYGIAGKMDQAREVLRQLEEMSRERYVSPYHMAYVYTGLGESEKALDLLEQAFRERAGSVYGIKGSFLFTSLREHPRFKALLGRMNLE